MKTEYQVAIVGAGPAGIAAATALRQAGIEDVVLLERERQAGGVPRHCRHPTFGLQTFYRPMLGSTYVDKILARAGQVEIRTGVTVLAIKPDGELTITDCRGVSTLKAQRVILATGVRETPRHPRLVSGLRPQGVLTAGALQQFVYLRGLQPGKAPVVIGTELVSFSALWTLRNAGVRAVAMIESGGRPVAWRLSALYARLMGVPIHYYSRVTDIAGRDRVESIEVENRQGRKRRIACDSLIFTGRFTGSIR
ncbi:FAD-dependent oxidoreductase [Serratia ureilytica]